MKDDMIEGGTAQPPAEGKLTVADVILLTIDALEKIVPEWGRLVTLTLLRNAVGNLHHYIKTDKKGEISWSNPFAELQYEVEFGEEAPPDCLMEEDAVALSTELLKRIPDSLNFLEVPILQALTRNVMIYKGEPCVKRVRPGVCRVILPPDMDAEVKNLPESERKAKLTELVAGFELSTLLKVMGTCITLAGEQAFTVTLVFAVRPLIVEVKEKRAFYPIQIGLNFTEGDPSAWSEENQDVLFAHLLKLIDDLVAPSLEKWKAEDKPQPKIMPPDRVCAVSPENFAVAGGYVRPVFGLSERVEDRSRLQEFYAPQTPLNWAVGLALFSLTDKDRIRSGDWQEVKIEHLVDRVFCLTERDAPRRDNQRTDILAEVVKLHTTRNWYYEIKTVQVGRAWKKRAVIGSQYAIPELQLVFLDTKTGKWTFPMDSTDAAVWALAVPLEVKSRRILKPDGKGILSLPPDRWKLEAIRWRWVQTFNDDLLLTPDLVENGKRKGLPKKTTRGKIIRKGYMIWVADNIFTALHKLRKEGPRSKYACRLLIMLAHNLNKTESGIAADRVFRMLGIPENYEARTHRKPEDLVATAIARLMSFDIKALLPTSDTTPRIDPNPDRRKRPYYRFIRSPDYTPRIGIASGITSKEDALAIEAEYADAGEAVEEDAQPPKLPGRLKANRVVLPGIKAPPAQLIPSGPDIKAAMKAAGITIREFAKLMGGPTSISTWSCYQNGKSIRVEKISPEVWQQVRDFIAAQGKL